MTPHGGITGTTVYALNLAEGLRGAGLDTRIICFAPHLDERLRQEAQARGIPFIYIAHDDSAALQAEMAAVNAVAFHGSKKIGDAIAEMPQRPKTIFIIHMESDLAVRDYCHAIIDENVAVAKWLQEKCHVDCHLIYTGVNPGNKECPRIVN